MEIENFEAKKCGNIITLKDKGNNKSKINLIANNAIFYLVEFDKVCDQSHGDRCDFVLYKNDKNAVLFAETKGNDIKKSSEQILNSNKLLNKSFSNSAKYAAISYSGSPKLNTTTQTEKIKFKKNGFEGLFIKSKQLKLSYQNGKIIEIGWYKLKRFKW